jgi:hypothetical protein
MAPLAGMALEHEAQSRATLLIPQCFASKLPQSRAGCLADWTDWRRGGGKGNHARGGPFPPLRASGPSPAVHRGDSRPSVRLSPPANPSPFRGGRSAPAATLRRTSQTGQARPTLWIGANKGQGPRPNDRTTSPENPLPAPPLILYPSPPVSVNVSRSCSRLLSTSLLLHHSRPMIP